ncbi:MAG: hypothetical protein M1376_05120 [Planctomycetes bacterium]|nr:hypothetical protein [Planctomycetota bacterium]
MEAVTVVFVLSLLACIAVPRLNFGAVWGAKADAVVRRLATDLRHTRALAITHAAGNPDGFVLVMRGVEGTPNAIDRVWEGLPPAKQSRWGPEPGPYRSYQIINRQDRTVIATCNLPAGVQCGGGRWFEFGPLGNLQNGSDAHLGIRTEGKSYRLEIAPVTGAVQWYRDDNQK